MPIRAVVYMSEAGNRLAGDKFGLASSKLDQIVDDAAHFNLDAGVTGVLLFDGTRFLQYLEGPDDGIGVAYSRVLGSSVPRAILRSWNCCEELSVSGVCLFGQCAGFRLNRSD